MLPGRAGQRLAVADQVVHLGLAEHFVGRDTQGLAAPLEDRFPDAFARAHDAAQGQPVPLARLGHRLHHQLQRRREKEGVGDLVALHQLEGALGRKPAARPDDGMAEVQRRQQGVHQPARPGPVGRRPEDVAAAWKPILRGHEAGQVADQHAVRQQGALGRAGGARRIEQDGRVLGARLDRLEGGGLAGQQGAPRQHPLVGEAYPDDLPQRRAAIQRGQDIAAGAFVDHGHARLGVTQALLERVGTEQGGKRQDDGADAVDGHVGDHGFRPLAQHDGHAVAAAHPHADQPVGELVGGLGQAAVSPDLAVAGFVFGVDCDAPRVGGAGGPPVAACLGDVELCRYQPVIRVV